MSSLEEMESLNTENTAPVQGGSKRRRGTRELHVAHNYDKLLSTHKNVVPSKIPLSNLSENSQMPSEMPKPFVKPAKRPKIESFAQNGTATGDAPPIIEATAGRTTPDSDSTDSSSNDASSPNFKQIYTKPTAQRPNQRTTAVTPPGTQTSAQSNANPNAQMSPLSSNSNSHSNPSSNGDAPTRVKRAETTPNLNLNNNRPKQSMFDRSRRKSLSKVPEKSEIEKSTDKIIDVWHKFKYKPLGFSVAADEFGCNAVVTKVTTANSMKAGIKVGFVVAKIKSKPLLESPHSEIVDRLLKVKLPATMGFVDRGIEYTSTFTSRPFGFSVMSDENKRNARVVRVNQTGIARREGVLKLSELMSINDKKTWGMQHDDIIQIIKNEPLPVVCLFRMTPTLLEIPTVLKIPPKPAN